MQKGNALKILNILHKVLLMGQILFAAGCIYIVYTKTILPPAKELDRILQVAALIITIAGIYAGMTIFKKKLSIIREMQTNSKEKFSLYRSASIVQWAFLEGPSIFCIISFFLTGNYAFLALAAAIIFLFMLMAPSKVKIITQLQISEAELEDL
jgi:hypothetical protein